MITVQKVPFRLKPVFQLHNDAGQVLAEPAEEGGAVVQWSVREGAEGMKAQIETFGEGPYRWVSPQ